MAEERSSNRDKRQNPRTLKLSDEGRRKIESARRRQDNGRGWITDDVRWLQEASRVLYPERTEDEWDLYWRNNPDKYALSDTTLKRFSRKKFITSKFFMALCEAVGENWQDVADLESLTVIGDPPNISNFYGRTTASTQLQAWSTDQKSRLIILYGRAGIGKTALARQIIEKVASQFDSVIWFSLESAPLLSELLNEIITYLPQEPNRRGDLLDFMQYLKLNRCLVVLDQWETIMQSDASGQYRENYSAYNDLLKNIGLKRHNSCFLIISRESPWSIDLRKAGDSVKLFQMEGLKYDEDKEFLHEENLHGTEAELRQFIEIYNNPLILQYVAEVIRDLHSGTVSPFVGEGATVLASDDIDRLIQAETDRLSQLERTIVYWLAIWRIPVSIEQLQEGMIRFIGRRDQFNFALHSLIKKHSIVKIVSDSEGYSLEAVTLKCITNKFVMQNSEELCSAIQKQEVQGAELFVNHAFVNHSEEELKNQQLRRIVVQTVEQLLSQFQNRSQLQQGLEQLQSLAVAGYAQPNIAHLLAEL